MTPVCRAGYALPGPAALLPGVVGHDVGPAHELPSFGRRWVDLQDRCRPVDVALETDLIRLRHADGHLLAAHSNVTLTNIDGRSTARATRSSARNRVIFEVQSVPVDCVSTRT